MTGAFDLWISGALYVIGARIMDVPEELRARLAADPRFGALAKAASIEDLASPLLQLVFMLSVGLVWYKVSFLSAVVYVAAALPGTFLQDALVAVARRLRAIRASVVFVGACVILGPALTGVGAYRLAGELARIARLPTPWHLWWVP